VRPSWSSATAASPKPLRWLAGLAIGALGGGVLQKFGHRVSEQRHSKESAKVLAALQERQKRVRRRVASG